MRPQLKNEQANLQPIHQQYLGGQDIYLLEAKFLTGVDLLSYQSRVLYGCKLLGYNAQQGCTP
jgi:filamentous hemagglutinin